MFIDSHAHLDGPEYDADRTAVLERARAAGLEAVVQIGYNRLTIERGLALFRGEALVHFTVGLHPHDAADWSQDLEDWIEARSADERVVAIGEVGLDWFRDYAPREAQLHVFRQMIRLARRRGLPLVVHSRAAEEDTLRLLEEERAADVGGVMHCYAYGAEAAARLKTMGFLVGFPCSVTYPKRNQREVIAALQVEQILLETDSPFLPPQSRRGRRNEPACLVEAAEVIAGVKGLTVADVARITTRNARRLFGLDLVDERVLAYPIRRSLYLNLTNRCTADCTFCTRLSHPVVKGHNLALRREQEATTAEMIAAIEAQGGAAAWEEFVFCGYGEPMMRLDVLKETAAWLKARGARVRVNTNGHSDLWHKRPTGHELAGLVDVASISLNADNAVQYNELVRPAWGERAFPALLDFARDTAAAGVEVVFTVVDDGTIRIEACRRLAEEYGATLRVRVLDETG
ncbi:MAG: YchF/TatD family DNA exonuclease [bacterium]|nr:YchF/TatD family DNA exonuclease [bacterium]